MIWRTDESSSHLLWAKIRVFFGDSAHALLDSRDEFCVFYINEDVEFYIVFVSMGIVGVDEIILYIDKKKFE